MDLKKNLSSILDEIKSSQNSCELIAVSKYVSVEEINALTSMNFYSFGENKVKDLHIKNDLVQNEQISWHFIGKLQSNKVKQLLKVDKLKMIHSIDSFKLVETLFKYSRELERSIDFLLQINTSFEEKKSGFKVSKDGSLSEELLDTLSFINEQNKFNINLNFKGFMCMAKKIVNIETDTIEVEKSFQLCSRVKSIVERDFSYKNLLLSMGMSSDYKIALKYGTNFVRLGSSIFGY